MRTSLPVLAFLLAMLAALGTAAADHKFHPLPGGKGRLAVKVVAYDGATNGVLTVAVKNTTGKPQRFSAEGLYFVPDGDPNTAPQRLGAVGPLQLASADDDHRQAAIEVAAGATAVVKLDVFCIDSHRDSPSSANTFTLGKSRLPKQLARTIEASAKAAAADEGGYAPAKGKIQGEVWAARDKQWVRLDGEGVQEAAK